MALKDLQKDVETWVSQYKIGYWKPHEIYARLGEEIGEVGREINHILLIFYQFLLYLMYYFSDQPHKEFYNLQF